MPLLIAKVDDIDDCVVFGLLTARVGDFFDLNMKSAHARYHNFS